ncbi:MAG: ECF-type sigma factor [Acidobacteriota bacterium]
MRPKDHASAQRPAAEGLTADRDETTILLRAWSSGDQDAGEALFARLYDDLRGVASRRVAVEPHGAIETTVLVHEAFLRLIDQRQVSWQDRGQFFAVAARVMRRILVDEARARGAEKRGGDVRRVELDKLGQVAFGERAHEVLVLDECLEDLARLDPDKARLVELRFFAGLSLEQTAEALGSSRATVVRQWRLTKGWLHRQLQTR